MFCITRRKSMNKPPLIVHIIHHLGVGGLENGLVNLINHISPDHYRHAIICLKGYSDFHRRINRDDVEIIALNKSEGHDLKLYFTLYKILKRLKPDIVHTRNLATIEGQVIAAIARIKVSVHGEHGRDIFDIHGRNRKYNLLRKAISPFVSHFIAVSKDLEDWLSSTVSISSDRISQIYNGVDCSKFHPAASRLTEIGPQGFFTGSPFVIGSVGRMAVVKDYPNLVRAFLILLKKNPKAQNNLRLLIVGEGESRKECIELLREAGVENLAWFPGERADVAELMRAMDIFVLPSLGEGISNTILEAMSSGLPVIATRVGGNVELVNESYTGSLVQPGKPEILADTLNTYYENPELIDSQGKAARKKVVEEFSMEAMMQGYLHVYNRVLKI